MPATIEAYKNKSGYEAYRVLYDGKLVISCLYESDAKQNADALNWAETAVKGMHIPSMIENHNQWFAQFHKVNGWTFRNAEYKRKQAELNALHFFCYLSADL